MAVSESCRSSNACSLFDISRVEIGVYVGVLTFRNNVRFGEDALFEKVSFPVTEIFTRQDKVEKLQSVHPVMRNFT